MKILVVLTGFALLCGSPTDPELEPVSITVLPDSMTLELGDVGTAICELRNKFGALLANTCAWVSRDSSIAKPTSGSQSSSITARKVGTVSVVAKAVTWQDSVQVTVLDTVTLPPPPLTIAPGESWQAKVDANPEGTVFHILAGRHIRQTVVPKQGTQFIGDAGAIMDGERATAYAFNGGGSNVVIRGLLIENYQPPIQQAAVQMGTAWFVESCEITESAHVGLKVIANGTARNNDLHHNHQYGIVGVGAEVLVEGNTIAYNNHLREFAAADEGGSKFVFTTNLVVRNNFVHHNGGPGLWTDIDNINSLIEGNTVEDNAFEGIFHEISWSAIIRNNIVRRNGADRPASLPEGSGIHIASSGGTGIEVYGNTLEGNKEGIMLVQADRGSGLQGEYLVKNVSVHDNTITLVDGEQSGADSYSDLQVFEVARNNHFENNTYNLQTAHAAPFLWNWAKQTDAQWRALGHDDTGTFNR